MLLVGLTSSIDFDATELQDTLVDLSDRPIVPENLDQGKDFGKEEAQPWI